MIVKIKRYTFQIKNYKTFLQNELVIDGCIVALIQIWEIASLIKKQNYDLDLPIKEMTEMRNFLVHAYHKVDPFIVRDTIENSIPELEKKIDIYLLIYE